MTSVNLFLTPSFLSDGKFTMIEFGNSVYSWVSVEKSIVPLKPITAFHYFMSSG